MNVIDLARAYAEHMDGWHAEPGDQPTGTLDEHALLVNDAERVRLRVATQWRSDRLVISPVFPYKAGVSGPRTDSITVNPSRDPAAAAKDILRRAVPRAIEGTRQAEASIAAEEEREARTRALRDEIAGEFPSSQPWEGGEPRFEWCPANADDDDARTRGTVKLSTHYRYDEAVGTFKEDGYRGDVELHGLTVEQVRRVLHALTDPS